MVVEVLDEPVWRARAEAHAARVDALVAPHLERRRDGVTHPVHDFLFTYYSQRPAQLRRWHPGLGVALAAAPEYAGLKGYATSCISVVEEVAQQPSRNHPGSGTRVGGGFETLADARSSTTEGNHPGTTVGVDPAYVASQRGLVESIRRLLVATEGRAPQLGCFGLHEWAMVHRQDETRHDWPLRLGRDGTDAVVESHRIACSHFDAFRFFTPSARPLNTLQPGRDDRPAFEQPACLHAGMDLYKHAFRLTPMVPSELVADCFELARDIRELDMRAAPYDLADLGVVPVRIETPAGKQEYVAAQRAFAVRGAPLRRRLVEECERLLDVEQHQP